MLENFYYISEEPVELHKLHSEDDQIKDKMGGSHNTHREIKNTTNFSRKMRREGKISGDLDID
jgi:hypothetical protein